MTLDIELTGLKVDLKFFKSGMLVRDGDDSVSIELPRLKLQLEVTRDSSGRHVAFGDNLDVSTLIVKYGDGGIT
jgi:hypothetical protein